MIMAKGELLTSIVLLPHLQRMRMMREYCAQTILALSDTMQRIAAEENSTHAAPDVLLQSIVEVVDVMLQLHSLLESKGSLRNDFVAFQR